MDPIVQVLIDRIEALAVDKAGLKSQLAGMRQDVQSAERAADERGQAIERLKTEVQLLCHRNGKLNAGLTAIAMHAESDARTLSSLIDVVRQATESLALDQRAEER